MPLLPVTVSSMEARMLATRNMVAKGEFEPALRAFQSIIQGVPMLAVDSV